MSVVTIGWLVFRFITLLTNSFCCRKMTDLFTELFLAQFVQRKELLSQNHILYKTTASKFDSHDNLQNITQNMRTTMTIY